MALTFSQLALFCAVVEEGTIYAAAEKMHCVPSNITARIHDLEYILKVMLFNRKQRKLSITPEGRAFYIQAKALVEQTKLCQDLFNQPQLLGDLNIGTINIVLEKYIHRQTLQFLKDHPTVQVNIYCGSSRLLLEKLLSAEFDLIFIEGIVQHPQLCTRVILHESLYLVFSDHSWLAFKQHATEQILFRYAAPNPHDQRLKYWLAQHRIAIHRQCTIESYRFALDAVQQQLGFTVVPSPFLAEAQQRQLHCIELSDIERGDISIAWKKSSDSKLIQRFTALFTTATENTLHPVKQDQ